MATTADRVKAVIIDKLGVLDEEVTPGASIENDLGADSLDKVDLVMALESEFNRSIPDEDVEKLTTVGEVTAYIEERIGSGE